MEKECKYHGLTEHIIRSDGRIRCKKCSIEAVVKRRKKNKIKAVEYKGGKCQIPTCGYDRYIGALTFHHINPIEKEFGISFKGHTISWERTKKELDKCILLCNRCHSELEAGLIEIPKNILV
jgi:5-methylcytosine-specific restriction endonuclease McrA